jgi:DNA-binding transcriptional ArsR family regulator
MRAQPLTKSRDLDIDMMMRSASQASAFLKALSHEARLVILCLLVEGEKSVSEIEKALSLRRLRCRSNWHGCAPKASSKLVATAKTSTIS